jgi:NodT family efflux transporter outer membrane factor (OMF) lipoprotein
MTERRSSRWVVALATSVGMAPMLAACTVGPDYVLPKEALVQAPAAQGALVGAANPSVTQAEPADDWWRLYQDPRLDSQIRQAFAANTDLRVAEATLERSRGLLREVRAAQEPSVAVNFDVGYQQLSGESFLLPGSVPATGLYDAGLSVSYDLDLFGRLRRTVEAVSADDEAVEAARDLVKVNVAADTARAYADLCNAGAELVVARHALDLQQTSLDLTRRLIAAGRRASLDEIRSRGQVAQLAATVPGLQARQRNALFRLATLTGHPPAQYDRSLEACATAPRVLAALPVGDGAQLLRRRPDVRAAERRLAASTAEIGVAVSGLYPDVTLHASLGSTGAVDDIFSAATNRYGIGPGISWQLNQSAARARIAMANAEVKADLARFDGSVLQALREIESALNVYVHDLERERNLKDARDQADQAALDAHRLQFSGRVDALTVLDAERTQAAANQALASQQSQVSLDQVAVFLALGGGWQEHSVQQTSSSS